MSRRNYTDSFWLSYSDLMTSLFFVMLVLFVICIGKMKHDNNSLIQERNEANARKEQLEQILGLEQQFETLSKSSALEYDDKKKMFFAKALVGKEIFSTNSDIILPQYMKLVDSVGLSLKEVVKQLHRNNPDLRFQLIIEGNAAIPWQQLQSKSYNPDNTEMYHLSYQRALALYKRWRSNQIDLRPYNTEVIIAGSGFNGKNRDEKKEENNKRFIIQIIPKVSKPK